MTHAVRNHRPWQGRLSQVYSLENTSGTPEPPVRQVWPPALELADDFASVAGPQCPPDEHVDVLAD